jgi:hypothetical protein
MVYFMNTWSILQSFVTFQGYLVKFVVIWYIFPRFGILDQEKSGNPDTHDPLERENYESTSVRTPFNVSGAN